MLADDQSNPGLSVNNEGYAGAGMYCETSPTTRADSKTAAQGIVDSGAANQGYAMEQRAWYVEQLFATSGEQIVNENNGRDARATEALLDSEAGEAVFTWTSEMLEEGLEIGRAHV